MVAAGVEVRTGVDEGVADDAVVRVGVGLSGVVAGGVRVGVGVETRAVGEGDGVLVDTRVNVMVGVETRVGVAVLVTESVIAGVRVKVAVGATVVGVFLVDGAAAATGSSPADSKITAQALNKSVQTQAGIEMRALRLRLCALCKGNMVCRSPKR